MAGLTTSPKDFSPELLPERLAVIGEKMLDILDLGISATSTENDCAYTRGVLPWGWIRNALINLAKSKQYDWLTLMHAGMDLVLGIGGVPVRYFLDDHQNPRKPRVLSPTSGEAGQLAFDFGSTQSSEPVLWRFFVERAISEEDEHRVFFTGRDAQGKIVAAWQFTESVRRFASVDDSIPEAAELGPVPLAPIYEIYEDVEAAGEAESHDQHENDAGTGTI
jgi:hypothetical protein